ncbi:MAG: alanyl-tRNA editing protein [Spirochaetaceae bacterium]|jgi:alanyl-tRNA synthetase|nr:alanyl-tRNA editing protein [Spirochaetaceae bacterium]
METERAYYRNDDAAGAEITEIRLFDGNRAAILLDKTIFYPEGGGQPGDRGRINRAAVLDVREKDGEILHWVSSDDAAALSLGRVELALDTARRRDLTVHHTAQHLLSGIIRSRTGVPTVSMHLGALVCTIDAATPEFPPEELLLVEEEAADAVERDHPVVIHLCPPENLTDFPLRKVPPRGKEAVRVVEIATRDFSPCCGTHLRSTGPIGIIRIVGSERYKGMTRLSFIAGRRVLHESRVLRREGERVSRALKAPVGEIGGAVGALLEKAAGLERKLKAMEEENALLKARDLVGQQGGAGARIVVSLPDADLREAQRLGRAAQKLTKRVVILGCPKECAFAAFRTEERGKDGEDGENIDLRRILEAPLAAFAGKGGGGPSFFQGRFPSERGLAEFMALVADERGKG